MLYIMRHGKTDWNAMRKLQGRTDIPLNEEGRQMAEHARTEYADIHFDICYCSPLIRAKETAEIVLKGRNIPIIITDDRLKEMSFGSYEGTANCVTTPGCPIKDLFLDPANYKVPKDGGESFEQLFARTGEFLKRGCKTTIRRRKRCPERRTWSYEFQYHLSGQRDPAVKILERRNRELQTETHTINIIYKSKQKATHFIQ